MVVIVDPHLKRESNYPAYQIASELDVLVKPKSGEGEYEGYVALATFLVAAPITYLIGGAGQDLPRGSTSSIPRVGICGSGYSRLRASMVLGHGRRARRMWASGTT